MFQTDSMQCLKCESTKPQTVNTADKQWIKEFPVFKFGFIVHFIVLCYFRGSFLSQKKKKKLTYLQSIHHVQEQHNAMGHKTDQQTNSIVEIANSKNTFVNNFERIIQPIMNTVIIYQGDILKNSLFLYIQWKCCSVKVSVLFWTPLTFTVWTETVETFYKMSSFVFHIQVWNNMMTEW